MPSGLIALIVLVVAMLLFGGFIMLRFGPPKDARRRQVKAAKARAARALVALHEIENVLQRTVLLDDVVASDMRQQCMNIITKHRNTELEIEVK